MKKKEAAGYLRIILLAIQRLRSITLESGGITDDPEVNKMYNISSQAAGEIWKWVWGKEHCLLVPLSKIIDDYDNTGNLAGSDFANIMYVAFELEPMISTVAGIEAVMNDVDFPSSFDSAWYKKLEEDDPEQ